MKGDDTLLKQLIDIVGSGKPVITHEELKQLQADAEQKGCGVVDILVKRKTLTSDDVARARANECGAEFVELERLKIDRKVLDLVTKNAAKRFRVIPIKLSRNVVTIATTDPYDFEKFGRFRQWSGLQIEIAIASEEAIDGAIRKYYPPDCHRGIKK